MTPEEHARLHRRRGRQALGLVIAVLVLIGTVPYVASVTAAGVCRLQGTAEGFYRLCSKYVCLFSRHAAPDSAVCKRFNKHINKCR